MHFVFWEILLRVSTRECLLVMMNKDLLHPAASVSIGFLTVTAFLAVPDSASFAGFCRADAT